MKPVHSFALTSGLDPSLRPQRVRAILEHNTNGDAETVIDSGGIPFADKFSLPLTLPEVSSPLQLNECAVTPLSPAREGPAPARLATVGLRPLLTIEQVADILSVSPKTVRRLIGRGLPCIRLGRVVRFRQADLLRFVEARKE